MTDEFNETLEQLELLIGKENAKKVAGFFEGMNIYFPKSIGLGELHNQIYEDLRNGAAYREAAAKYGYTKSYIRKIERKITDRRRRERQARKPEERNATARPGAGFHTVTPETPNRNKHHFGQGDLFYVNGN